MPFPRSSIPASIKISIKLVYVHEVVDIGMLDSIVRVHVLHFFKAVNDIAEIIVKKVVFRDIIIKLTINLGCIVGQDLLEVKEAT
jgi:hypothetical protein